MTALLFARDTFRSEILQSIVNTRFMLNRVPPTITVEEEILDAEVESVLVRPLAFLDKQALDKLNLQPQHL